MSCIERVVARTAAQASARMPPPVLQQSSDMLARLATTGSLPASSTTAQWQFRSAVLLVRERDSGTLVL